MGLQKSGTTDKFTFYYQNKDHLGTVRETVTSTGAMKQRVNYYPFGGQLVDTLKVMIWNRDFQQYKYNGKEFDGTFGLNTYDYGARQHDPVLARWDRIDPLCEKYYGVSPYAYCANNPVRFIDPDGRTIEADSLSQTNIINTVTPEEADYIQFDEKGMINVDLLNKCNSTSENFLSIKQLAISQNNYVFKVADKGHDGREFYDHSNGDGNFYRGVTEMPGAQNGPSPDNNIYICRVLSLP
ncbi:RHS repeat-associated core domain-containing protein [Prevotella aff. ruminicola Tc2-24]|uniref:RHS repeat-associated core domain-containing protein n=1 Tax=Prevotella aff. ruminicola Tc2-24 TaxID=81582 RepID=A0A1I0PRA3_9BACT|nr:RHS repeat-associated core domain-containing protein [Prevotella aff. ruminicola Tc2-24]SEW16931.1 RHS repeat-associated core domain-containing protein [Prevotella aff. ruminicola Tc2-24]